MLNLIFKNYKKYHENQRKKLRRLIYISSKSNFDAQTLFASVLANTTFFYLNKSRIR